jgi:uncharacterized protein YecT (DUF1311 family)
MTTRLLAAAAALLAVTGAAQARPPDHYQTIGWMSSVDLDCEESAQNPFAPSDHICMVKHSSSVWATSKLDKSKFKIAAGTHVWGGDGGNGNVEVSLILPNTSCSVVTRAVVSVTCPGIANANDWVTKARGFSESSAPSTGVPNAGPSFNCNNAKAPDEVAICQNRFLATDDLAMSNAYFDVRRLAGDDTYGLEQSQRQWLAERRKCGSNNECLHEMYLTRLQELTAARKGYEEANKQ